MNKIDISLKLIHCKSGMQLDCTISDNVIFNKVIEDYQIECLIGENKDRIVLDRYGQLQNIPCSKCIIFPKDQRDWSKFNIEPEMVDGEIYYAKIGFVEWIFIYKRTYTFKTSHYVAVLNNYLMEFNNICTTHNEDIKILRKATDEEKQLFFELIEKNGRKWDADKKELVRIESKFDVNTLQPFDKVLVRSSNDTKWRCDLFSFVCTEYYKFCCVGYAYSQCIPYNDETKHLVGTTKMPPKEYINWEGK